MAQGLDMKDISSNESKSPLDEECSLSSTEEKKKDIYLLVSIGLTGLGKSTALNNVFGSNFDSSMGAKSGTKSVNLWGFEKDGYDLIIVDTPGFAARDIPKQEIKRDISSHIGDLPLVLIYCYRIDLRSSVSTEEKKVVKFLQKTFGRDIWKRAVLLLTHSDTLRSESETEREYIDMVSDHVKYFNTFLKKECGSSHVPDVKAVFDPDLKPEDLVAIPVGKKVCEDGFLIPNMKKGWNEIAYEKIMEKALPIEHDKVHRLSRSSSIQSLVSDAREGKGSYLGLVFGAVFGFLFGGFGAIPGAAVGTAIGTAADNMIDASNTSKKDSKIKKMKSKFRSFLHADRLTHETKFDSLQNSLRLLGKDAYPGSAARGRARSRSFHGDNYLRVPSSPKVRSRAFTESQRGVMTTTLRNPRETQLTHVELNNEAKAGQKFVDPEEPMDEEDMMDYEHRSKSSPTGKPEKPQQPQDQSDSDYDPREEPDPDPQWI